MSTSQLYHEFGIKGYDYVNTLRPECKTVFTIKPHEQEVRCSVCQSRNVGSRGHVWREWRTVPIGKRPVFVMMDIPRVGCKDCGAIRQIRVTFAEGQRSYTRSFERYVLDLSRHMTIQDVARHLSVGWDVVKNIQKRELTQQSHKIRLRHLRVIAIDEICIGHGQKYLTVVLDLRSGRVVFVGEGKGMAALEPFWKRLRGAHPKIRAVAMDLSAAFRAAVEEHLPKAVIVYDHFHVIKLFNEKLSDLRRAMVREATEKMEKKVIKGTRWLLLKNPEHLEEGRNERQRLEEVLAMNRPLAVAYYMKEDLRQIWGQPDKRTARRLLDDWIRRAESSGILILKKFAHTLATHRTGILAFYDYPISTGPLEGTNNKIRVMQRQAYGFRDTEFLKLKILSIHRTSYKLVG